jgi:hypothetical protein
MERTGPAAVLLFLMAATGCGGRQGSVSGVVTYNGRPLTGGTVVFIGADGKPSEPATIGPDGKYSATDVPAGRAKVAVDDPPPATPPPGSVPKEMANDPEVREARSRAVSYVPIPPKYRDPDQSGLAFDVKSGSNTFDIPLR